jgi:hypothetical protein
VDQHSLVFLAEKSLILAKAQFIPFLFPVVVPDSFLSPTPIPIPVPILVPFPIPIPIPIPIPTPIPNLFWLPTRLGMIECLKYCFP